jgi:hypothetical protein
MKNTEATTTYQPQFRPTMAEWLDARTDEERTALAIKIDGHDHIVKTVHAMSNRCVCGESTYSLQMADADRMIRRHS